MQYMYDVKAYLLFFYSCEPKFINFCTLCELFIFFIELPCTRITLLPPIYAKQGNVILLSVGIYTRMTNLELALNNTAFKKKE